VFQSADDVSPVADESRVDLHLAYAGRSQLSGHFIHQVPTLHMSIRQIKAERVPIKTAFNIFVETVSSLC
jgi:hypothetical protein